MEYGNRLLFLLVWAALGTQTLAVPARKLAVQQLSSLQAALSDRNLLDCVIRSRVQATEATACFTQVGFRAELSPHVVSITDVIVDLMYNQQQCLEWRTPELVRVCIKQLKKDLRRYLGYKPRHYDEKNQFLELIKSIVGIMSERRNRPWGPGPWAGRFLPPPPSSSPITLNINNQPGQVVQGERQPIGDRGFGQPQVRTEQPFGFGLPLYQPPTQIPVQNQGFLGGLATPSYQPVVQQIPNAMQFPPVQTWPPISPQQANAIYGQPANQQPIHSGPQATVQQVGLNIPQGQQQLNYADPGLVNFGGQTFQVPVQSGNQTQEAHQGLGAQSVVQEHPQTEAPKKESEEGAKTGTPLSKGGPMRFPKKIVIPKIKPNIKTPAKKAEAASQEKPKAADKEPEKTEKAAEKTEKSTEPQKKEAKTHETEKKKDEKKDEKVSPKKEEKSGEKKKENEDKKKKSEAKADEAKEEKSEGDKEEDISAGQKDPASVNNILGGGSGDEDIPDINELDEEPADTGSSGIGSVFAGNKPDNNGAPREDRVLNKQPRNHLLPLSPTSLQKNVDQNDKYGFKNPNWKSLRDVTMAEKFGGVFDLLRKFVF